MAPDVCKLRFFFAKIVHTKGVRRATGKRMPEGISGAASSERAVCGITANELDFQSFPRETFLAFLHEKACSRPKKRSNYRDEALIPDRSV